MSNLRPQVRSAIKNFLASQDGHHLKADVLRVIEEEANLMKETENVRDILDMDPMEQLADFKPQVERLKTQLSVTSCSRVRTGHDYARIHAVVGFAGGVELTFLYERKRRHGNQNHGDDDDEDGGGEGCHVRYSIELSKNHQQRENLLVVEVWAPKSVPSTERAVCINHVLNEHDDDDDDDDWEDIEESEHNNDSNMNGCDTSTHGKASTIKRDDAVVSDDSPSQGLQKQPTKRQKLCDNTPPRHDHALQQQTNEVNDDKEPVHDSFLAYLDPDLLHEFLDLTGISPMEEGTSFFLLMTFPFYEHEWDLVGYVLDEVFGCGDDEGEDESGGQ